MMVPEDRRSQLQLVLFLLHAWWAESDAISALWQSQFSALLPCIAPCAVQYLHGLAWMISLNGHLSQVRACSHGAGTDTCSSGYAS